ncbi:MAG TPA: hypothetical protein DDW55_07875 [Gammaproteobacteria bacterium]|nr:hypothetical protein [Gammaproteobacteria bacterium]
MEAQTITGRVRDLLSRFDGLPKLSLLGLLTGLLAAVVIILFRELTESTQENLLGLSNPDSYEDLTALTRILLATGGGLLLGLVFHFLATPYRAVGVAHVMERLRYHQGHLPWRNGLVQFFGAAASIVSGHSVGREGPGIHLGATTGSMLAGSMGLSSNHIRTLVACGAAASIAAGFDTPLAGVIFVMEVIMMEYTFNRFTPVILAAVSATVLTRIYYQGEAWITIEPLAFGSIWEISIFLVIGPAIGALAALFIYLLLWISRTTRDWPVWLRFSLAGLSCGLLAMPTPEIMGIGYDTINGILLGESSIMLLLGIVVFKLLATTIAIGLGLPGGLIGPTLVIGAAAGGIAGIAMHDWLGDDLSAVGFFAMIGMATMMGATLQAPLAALMALLELTANPSIILPGMLAVITANLTCSELFRQQSIFVMLMRARGLDPNYDPFVQSLQSKGIHDAVEHRVQLSRNVITVLDAQAMLELNPRFIVVRNDTNSYVMFPLVDLINWLKDHNELAEEDVITLLEIPAQYNDLALINTQASMFDALETMDSHNVDALLVEKRSWQLAQGCCVLTRDAIRDSYRFDTK